MVDPDPSGRILVVEDRPESVAWFRGALEQKNKLVDVSAFDEALVRARGGDFDLIVVSLGIRNFDGLRLCSHLRSLPEVRNSPILVLVSEGESRKLIQALDMGVNDYLMRPVDRNELLARIRTQLRKKRYSDKLRHNVQLSLEMAITDPLTGLHNRRYMSSHLDTLMKSASAAKPISFLIMDIDHFKSINDTHGHSCGDYVLKTIAKAISKSMRKEEVFARYGGEEFVVLLRETDLSKAGIFAARILKLVSGTALEWEGKKLQVTVSLGVASTSHASFDSVSALFERADQLMYQAKRGGRNRFCHDG
jgi:two-component system cell cycle response regulator